ncbi:ankyrin repeat domain-containing protein [Mycolicibacterium sp. P9-64]|uniref:ankyrin repeat domain-containing protein n=1 Tax=Mycolicibacterium sp. P9-64 TaxID=2024612 RepID=UPI0011ED4070|nr:ankyrin repeat domain-containing protein [Mycolicibacterium sp. P9-64]KAA0074845.1 ankyrin repeat domain-containing protein [Mycolicibacterium sp. P9-64]
MASSLPNNPSLDRLKADARRLQRGVTAGDQGAVDVVKRCHPKPSIVLADSTSRFALHDAQLTVARSYGFSGWPALVHYLRIAAGLTVDPSAVDEDALDKADRFCALSALRYDDDDAPPRWQAAADLLADDPTLVDRHVWAAAAASDVVALQRHLTADPALARREGGPFGWVPLLHLTYSRASLGRTQVDVLEAAATLLDAGADPNAGYLWCGMSTPFTALTGVFGEGEQGPRRQPRHPNDQALATLLLERGAHPEDQQTLYNRMFRPGNDHLELLFAYGLGRVEPGPWHRRLGEAMETTDQMWARQVGWAAAHGFADRLTLLGAHGVDVSGVTVVERSVPEDPNERDADGVTALHHAAREGDVARIRLLLDAGADPSITDGRFGTTPLGWAEHAYQSEAADLLRPVTP